MNQKRDVINVIIGVVVVLLALCALAVFVDDANAADRVRWPKSFTIATTDTTTTAVGDTVVTMPADISFTCESVAPILFFKVYTATGTFQVPNLTYDIKGDGAGVAWNKISDVDGSTRRWWIQITSMGSATNVYVAGY